MPSFYKNTFTFLYFTSVSDIDPNNLIVLDGYAFDVDELISYAETNLEKFYQNPHLTAVDQNKGFSDSAKAQLREHAVLKKYALQLDNTMQSQKAGILPETVTAIEVLLREFAEQEQQHRTSRFWIGSVEGTDKTLATFVAHKTSLTLEQQNTLDNYIIHAPV